MWQPLILGFIRVTPDLGPRVMAAAFGAIALFFGTRPGPFYWGRLGSAGPRMPTKLARAIFICGALGLFLFAIFGKGMTFR